MTLKQLEALYWAGSLGSFSLAAERLCTTQSSLSKRILELEQELGEKLFDRSGSRVRLTSLGARILSSAQQMLSVRDNIVQTARGRYGLSGACRFGVSELVALTWLPDIVAKVRKAYPDVTLDPHVAIAADLFTGILRGEIDFAVGPATSPDASIISQHLGEVDMVWVCAPHLMSPGESLTAKTFLAHPVISMSRQAAATAFLDHWAVENGIKFRRVVTSNSLGTVAALAAAGLGICLLPKPIAVEFIERERLRTLRVARKLAVPRLAYYLHARKAAPEALSQAVREIVLTTCSAPMSDLYNRTRTSGN